MGNTVNWGILSAAKIAKDWVAPAIHMSARGRVAAVASRTPGKAAALAAPYGDVALYDNYDAMLADPTLDAVYVGLPNSDHVPWTKRALAAGKHVLCEKPIALNAAEIDGLIAARDAADRLAAEAFMVVHHPQWLRVRALLAAGAIGRLRHIQGAFAFFNDDPGNIRNQADLGGGALRDIGVYPCVTARFATGAEPTAARAAIDWEAGIDATARVQLDFPDFALDFYVSMRMAGQQRMVFHGDQGVLTVETPFNAEAFGDDAITIRKENQVVRERFPLAGQYIRQADAFHASVLDGADYPCTLEFSQANQRVIDMIYKAAGAN